MERKSEFRIESGPFLAGGVATIPCDIERLESYEESIPGYQSRDFTYIPMPYDEKYYNVDEGWLREINPEQYLGEDTFLLKVLEKLQHHPFLLFDYKMGAMFELYEGDFLVPASFFENYSLNHNRIVSYEESLNIEISEFHDWTGSIYGFREEAPDSVQSTTIGEIRADNDRELLDTINEVASKIDNQDRFGIITISDLNRRPMKEMFYRALSELEITISKNIEDVYNDSRRLFKPARPDTIGRWEKDQIEGLGLHIAEYMTLIELKESLKMSDRELVKRCGFDSKDEIEDLNSINTLRNKVMHANRTLIHNRRDIENLMSKLDRIEEIINNSTQVKHWS